MCGNNVNKRYKAVPSIRALVDWDEMFICNKCARREVGTKNVKKWRELHENR